MNFSLRYNYMIYFQICLSIQIHISVSNILYRFYYHILSPNIIEACCSHDFIMLACDKRVLCVGRVMCRHCCCGLTAFFHQWRSGNPTSLENLIYVLTVWKDVGSSKIYGEKLLVLDVSMCGIFFSAQTGISSLKLFEEKAEIQLSFWLFQIKYGCDKL